ncbi:hypothetical protein [Micromonospora sp. KC213]|uniref:hypothetical protein n=1 Tax=Micromonospora sp. KC213 TaxID=2530378 RepID=UPI001FB6759A|nr:hypothetical protein [Micromonospora sp. KC213]
MQQTPEVLVQLRYGMNPQQSPASVEPIGAAPFTVVHGRPSYLNLLDAISARQLVREAAAEPGTTAAASPDVPLQWVSLASDGALPFEDNITEAAEFGVRHIAEPGGSIRSHAVAEAARRHGIGVTRTGLRLFRH